MCGISVILHKSGAPVAVSELKQMNKAIAHRGPDGEGSYCFKNIGLGHRRLSIIDLSDAGAQPMHYLNRYTLVFNGEIYNYRELRAELLQKGYSFQSHTDTEVIMAAYDHWGLDCLQKFNGMWAFALLDRQCDELFCSRDRFGVKPFYLLQTAEKWMFGSEIKQLLPFLGKRKVNTQTLAEYLVLGLEDTRPQTFFEGIEKLPAGHYFKCSLRQNKPLEFKCYYQLQPYPFPPKIALAEAQEQMEALLDSSIRLRLRSDVQVGTCLSGGIDSSTIAAWAAEHYRQTTGQAFLAITASSTDPQNDEKHFAEMVAKKCGLQWQVIAPGYSDFLQAADEVIKLQEEPFGSASIIMQYFVMQAARNLHCPVLLDGQGGDETMLGYERYYPSYLMQLPLWKRWHEAKRIAWHSKWSHAQLIKAYFYFTQARLRLYRQKRRYGFLKNYLLSAINPDQVKQLANAYSDTTELQKTEITITQLPHLLRYEDKNSMHFGIETRLPLLDYRWVEAALGLPAGMKINGGFTKYLLRKIAAQKLPDEISWRKIKFGFEAPSKHWLLTDQVQQQIEESALIQSICNNIPTASADLQIRWKLFNLARWERLYEVEL